MGYSDLKEWIATLEENNELTRVKAEVDPEAELAAICRKTLDKQGPALLFENIKGHKNAWCGKLFQGGLGSIGRVAMMLGLPKDTPRMEVSDMVRKRLRERIQPVEVATGSVKKHVIKDKIDLAQIPVPKWHPLDGGKYINVWAGVVTRDPETGKHNIGMYRGMIVGPDKIANLLLASQHWGEHFTKYKKMGKPMPVAYVYGYDESLGYCAGIQIPRGVCEYDVMGAMRQKPVELVKCETSDLLVPAGAEIVIEGYISPDPIMEMEGPFGEFTGYYAAERKPRPTTQITCITHCDDPIYRGALEGAGPGHPNEDSSVYWTACRPIVLNILEDAGVPGVLDAKVAPINVIKIDQTFSGQAHQVASALWGNDCTEYMMKTIMVVNDDIDIWNPAAVDWAFGSRVDPQKDIVVFPGTKGGALDPSMPKENREEDKLCTGRQNRVLIDATFNFSHRDEWFGQERPPFSFNLDPEVEAGVEKRWTEYGIALPEKKGKKAR